MNGGYKDTKGTKATKSGREEGEGAPLGRRSYLKIGGYLEVR